jgi:toxin ParE1/3/4
MPRVERTSAAERSLDEIFDYIGRENHSPLAAANVLRKIIEKCDIYAHQPLMGEARKELGPQVRCFPVGSYAVFYEALQDGMRVLLVIRGQRDIPTVFRETFGLSER